MASKLDRRGFVKSSAAVVGGLALGASVAPEKAQADTHQNKAIRLGFVGIGDRGSYHLDSTLGIEVVEVPAVCDINDAVLYRAKQWVEDAELNQPQVMVIDSPGTWGLDLNHKRNGRYVGC